MPKQQTNKMIGDRLEKRIWRLMWTSAKQLGNPKWEIAPDRSIRESLTIDNETGHWAFFWYEGNTNEKGSNPDFTINHGNKILLAIEAKNHDPKKHHPNLQWTNAEVIRRFQFHDAETKILYIPLLNPTPKDRDSVLNALRENHIITLQIRRPIADRGPYAYDYVRRDLGPYIERAIQNGKN